MADHVNWRIEDRDTGTLCAGGSALTEAAAMREMNHYALQYVQDGSILCVLKRGRKTLQKQIFSLHETEGK